MTSCCESVFLPVPFVAHEAQNAVEHHPCMAVEARNCEVTMAWRYQTTFDDGDLTAGVMTITHGLGRDPVHVSVTNDDDQHVDVPWSSTSSTVVAIDFSAWGTLVGTYKVSVM